MLVSAQHTLTVASCFLLLFLLDILPQVCHSRPSHGYTTDGTELIVVEETVHCTRQDFHELCQNDTTTKSNEEQQQKQEHTINVDNESVMDIMDDLILLENKPKQKHQQQQQQRKEKYPYGTYQQQQSDLLTSAAAREDTLVAAAAAAPAIGDPVDSTALGSSYHQESFDSDSDSNANGDDNDAVNIKTTDVDAVNAAAADEIIADGVLFHGALLRLADGPHSVPQPVPPIDMSDFVSLIPVEEVKSIATNYYNIDTEVQSAYAFLSGRDFIALRQQIIASPEVSAFLQYLNISGFDVLKFVSAIANLTTIDRKAESDGLTMEIMNSPKSLLERERQVENENSDAPVIVVNEISKVEHKVPSSTNLISTLPPRPEILDQTMSTLSTKVQVSTTNFAETKTQQLNGLHGLVDSILETLPQDQILATFFDKLETDENFRKFVNNIQRPAFAQILSKMEQSMSLRNLIFTLHNNGIYITRIVDSLKAYFFLGGFS